MPHAKSIAGWRPRTNRAGREAAAFGCARRLYGGTVSTTDLDRRPMTETLEKWHDFYILVGTASATLVALLFVAASLGTGLLTAERTAPTRTYMSPVVIHFAAVFFIAAVALAPALHRYFFAGLIGAAGLTGAIIAAVISVRLLAATRDVADRLAYGVVPALAYLVVVAAAWLTAAGTAWALDLLAGALLTLLIVNIRNVWDLTLAMIRMPRDKA